MCGLPATASLQCFGCESLQTSPVAVFRTSTQKVELAVFSALGATAAAFHRSFAVILRFGALNSVQMKSNPSFPRPHAQVIPDCGAPAYVWGQGLARAISLQLSSVYPKLKEYLSHVLHSMRRHFVLGGWDAAKLS